MSASPVEQTDTAAAVFEDHEVLAEDLYPLRQFAQLRDKRYWLPESAQVFATRRSGADVR